jgi:predicted RNase H-like HicB family nuclease
MKTYTAVCERDETGVWVITVPALRGIVTQSRRLDKARDHAAEAIALWLDTAPAEFDVDLDVRLARHADLAATAIRLRREAESLQTEASNAARVAAKELVERDGLTLRDAAIVLHLSHQRVQQLLAEDRRTSDTRTSIRQSGRRKRVAS